MASWVRTTGVTVLTVLAVAGCSASTGGHGSFGGSGGPAAPPSSTGTPGPAPAVRQAAAIVESHRLGVNQADPTKVVSQATQCGMPSGPFPSVKQAAAIVFGADTDKLLDLGGYVAGWFQCYKLDPTTQSGAVVGTMVAYDEAHARALAQVITLSSAGGGSAGSLPGLPQAYVGQDKTEGDNSSISAMLVGGRTVSYVYIDTGRTAGGKDRLGATQRTAAQLLKAQAAASATFQPTPVDKLNALDDDPALLDGKVAQPEGVPDWRAGGYSLETYPEIATDAHLEMPVLRAAGLSEIYLRNGNSEDPDKPGGQIAVYRLRDATAARTVVRAELSIARRQQPPRSALALPTSKPKKKGQKPQPVGPAGMSCLVYSLPGSSSSHPFVHECWFAAGRLAVQVQMLLSADQVSTYKTKIKDPTAILALVQRQLRLTPQ